jgi:predicted amidohydrolase
MKQKFKIALAQITSVRGEKTENIKRIERIVTKAEKVHHLRHA